MPAQYPGIGFPPSSEVGLLRRICNNLALIAEGGGGGGGVTSILAGSGISVDQPTGAVTVSATGMSGPSGVDPDVTSLAELSAVATVALTPPVVKVWVQESDGTMQTWRLLAGTDATVPGSIQRPDDYGGGNQKVWYRAS